MPPFGRRCIRLVSYQGHRTRANSSRKLSLCRRGGAVSSRHNLRCCRELTDHHRPRASLVTGRVLRVDPDHRLSRRTRRASSTNDSTLPTSSPVTSGSSLSPRIEPSHASDQCQHAPAQRSPRPRVLGRCGRAAPQREPSGHAGGMCRPGPKSHQSSTTLPPLMTWAISHRAPRSNVGGPKLFPASLPGPALSLAGAFSGWPDSSARQTGPARPERAGIIHPWEQARTETVLALAS
jgi:hypothetical protein